MDESAARQALLAQAIEETDTEGRLVDAAMRDRVDRQALQDALHHPAARDLPADEFVAMRARRLVAEAAIREPMVAALQDVGAWRGGIEWGLPMLALATGVLTDVVGNPHRLDLVSLPLLGIVVWNLVVYGLLALAMLLPARSRSPWVARLARGTPGFGWRWRRPGLRTQVALRFQALWWPATAALNAARWKRVLHLSAAAWAVGVILSLLVRGLVVEYKVGWESTFLDPAQVHAILSLLRWPALLVLPFESFSVIDVADLRFSNHGGAQGGAPWVWMYVALLITLVVLPRLLLATVAAWRESRLERQVAVPLDSGYYRRIVSLLDTTGVTIGLLAHRATDREAFLAAVAREAEGSVLVSSDLGDALRLIELPLAIAPPAPPRPWWQRWRPAPSVADPAAACDVVVHLCGSATDEADAAAILAAWQRPALHVRMQGDAVAEGRNIAIEDFASAPWRGRKLLLALRECLPADAQPGFDRVVQAWDAREARRLQASMEAVARMLVDAARMSEEVPGSALTVRNLMPAERQAQAQARDEAIESLATRLRERTRDMSITLCQLHGLPADRAGEIEHRLHERLSVQQSVDAPQAGMAGAATGAAMGASVDLLTGGLTLGAAAALGALVGGGAAFVAAAWKNRTAPDGGTAVQVGDPVLVVLAEAALLRYLAIAQGGQVDPAWPAVVAKSLEDVRDLWPGYWAPARQQPEAHRLVEPLAVELRNTVERVIVSIG